jgi:hypothetical protein
VIGQWEKLFTPSMPFLMTPSSGAMIEALLTHAAGISILQRVMMHFQSERTSIETIGHVV